MDDNSYQSPQFNQPAEKRELLPLWRNVVSSALIFFGISYLCFVPLAAIVAGLHDHLIVGLAWAMFYLVLGAAMTWYGRLLRCQPPSNTQSRTTGRIVD
jgi:hypothetical protein